MLENTKLYTYYLIPYSVIVSSLYLFGYWGSFNISIFEFIGIADILMISIFQLILYGSGTIIGALFFEFVLRPPLDWLVKENKTHVKTGNTTPRNPFLFYLLIIIWIMVAIYPIIFTLHPYRWMFSAGLISPIIFHELMNSNFLADVIQKLSVRGFVLQLMTLILLSSYGYGVLQATLKKQTNETIEINNIALEQSYLGKGGQYLFLWDKKAQRVEILKEESVNSIKISVNERTQTFFEALKEGLWLTYLYDTEKLSK